jgi:hypothetical protein
MLIFVLRIFIFALLSQRLISYPEKLVPEEIIPPKVALTPRVDSGRSVQQTDEYTEDESAEPSTTSSSLLSIPVRPAAEAQPQAFIRRSSIVPFAQEALHVSTEDVLDEIFQEASIRPNSINNAGVVVNALSGGISSMALKAQKELSSAAIPLNIIQAMKEGAKAATNLESNDDEEEVRIYEFNLLLLISTSKMKIFFMNLIISY